MHQENKKGDRPKTLRLWMQRVLRRIHSDFTKEKKLEEKIMENPIMKSEERVKLLVGNSFPFNLIRRPVLVLPTSTDAFVTLARGSEIHSYWSHTNTLAVAKLQLGLELTPRRRPTIWLDGNNYPMLGEEVFSQSYIVLPEYRSGFRPKVGVEVVPEQVTGWQIVNIQFLG